jgi:hypothetical protein
MPRTGEEGGGVSRKCLLAASALTSENLRELKTGFLEDRNIMSTSRPITLKRFLLKAETPDDVTDVFKRNSGFSKPASMRLRKRVLCLHTHSIWVARS